MFLFVCVSRVSLGNKKEQTHCSVVVVVVSFLFLRLLCCVRTPPNVSAPLLPLFAGQEPLSRMPRDYVRVESRCERERPPERQARKSRDDALDDRTLPKGRCERTGRALFDLTSSNVVDRNGTSEPEELARNRSRLDPRRSRRFLPCRGGEQILPAGDPCRARVGSEVRSCRSVGERSNDGPSRDLRHSFHRSPVQTRGRRTSRRRRHHHLRRGRV